MTKKQLKAANRSGLKTCEICKERAILVEHHIQGRKIDKPNHKSNLCYICDNCHRKVHNLLIKIDAWYDTTAGRELTWFNV